MLKYSDLQDLLKKNDDQIQELEYKLYEGMKSFHDVLVEYLEPPSDSFEQIMSIEEGHRNVEIRERVKLEDTSTEVNDDGRSSFTITLNFEDHKPFVYHFNIRLVDDNPVYRLTESAIFLSKEKMAEAMIDDFAKTLGFNLFPGKETP